MTAEEGRGIGTGWDDLPAVGPRRLERETRHLGGDPAAPDRGRDPGVRDRHDPVREAVVDLAILAVDAGFETLPLRIVAYRTQRHRHSLPSPSSLDTSPLARPDNCTVPVRTQDAAQSSAIDS